MKAVVVFLIRKRIPAYMKTTSYIFVTWLIIYHSTAKNGLDTIQNVIQCTCCIQHCNATALNKVNFKFLSFCVTLGWGLAAGYQPRPQVVDRGTTARYGGQLRYI